MRSVSFLSLGCRVNQYEIQALREMFLCRGWSIVPYGEPCDACVINTCAVTKESEKKSRHTISHASSFSKSVIITGCYAELSRLTDNMPKNVFYCGGCSQRNLIPDICDNITLPYKIKTSYEELSIGNTGDLPNERYRAYVKIQDGCNGRCSYCVIPKLRGKSYNRDEENIINEILRLAKSGVSEVILTGIEVSDYGTSALCSLIRKVNKINEIKRIRLGSVNPNTISDDFVNTLIECEKACKHIHLSVQSGSNRVLNLMRRPYSAEKLNSAVKKLYDSIPNIMLTADVISGFPGETEEHFTETVDFIKNSRFMHIHAFPYSPRPFTDAVGFEGQVDAETKKNRNAHIIAVSEAIKKSIAEGLIGSKVEVLVEKLSKNVAFGHTDGFWEAKIICGEVKVGDYVLAEVTGYDGVLLCKQLIN